MYVTDKDGRVSGRVVIGVDNSINLKGPLSHATGRERRGGPPEKYPDASGDEGEVKL